MPKPKLYDKCETLRMSTEMDSDVEMFRDTVKLRRGETIRRLIASGLKYEADTQTPAHMLKITDDFAPKKVVKVVGATKNAPHRRVTPIEPVVTEPLDDTRTPQERIDDFYRANMAKGKK